MRYIRFWTDNPSGWRRWLVYKEGRRYAYLIALPTRTTIKVPLRDLKDAEDLDTKPRRILAMLRAARKSHRRYGKKESKELKRDLNAAEQALKERI